MTKILIVDDEPAIRRSLRDILEYEKYAVEEAKDGVEAVAKIKTGSYEAMLCDIKMPQMDGIDVLERAVLLAPDMPVIMISGHADLETAVDCVRRGAFDFIAKPLDLNRLLITIRNALDKSSLVAETKVLKTKIRQYRGQEMIGASAPMRHIRETIDKVAPTEARVLITGPNGAGKELVARWIHEKSQRADQPLVEVNCAAIPSELIESELFGHEKGSFTSAVKQRIGKFEQASGGTLFLDEIGDMSLSAQAKVLRALQEHKITRVGGEKDIKVDVRIIAATNKDLRQEIEAKRFREDLYHRLAVIIVQVPSLNDRREDIPALAEHFLSQICSEYGNPAKSFHPQALELLQTFDWTGNIRELRNVVERLIILSDSQITPEDVQTYVRPNMSASDPLRELLGRFDTFEELQGYLRAEWERRR
jgi:DNA-binding NtrC family response regulator